jgi:hypothetical protein
VESTLITTFHACYPQKNVGEALNEHRSRL